MDSITISDSQEIIILPYLHLMWLNLKIIFPNKIKLSTSILTSNRNIELDQSNAYYLLPKTDIKQADNNNSTIIPPIIPANIMNKPVITNINNSIQQSKAIGCQQTLQLNQSIDEKEIAAKQKSLYDKIFGDGSEYKTPIKHD